MSVLTLLVLNDPPANGGAERQFAAAAPRPPPTPQPHPHQLRPSAVLRRSGRPSAAAPLSQSSLGWRRRSRAWRPGRKPSSRPWGRNWTPPVAAWPGTATTNWRYVHFFLFLIVILLASYIRAVINSPKKSRQEKRKCLMYQNRTSSTCHPPKEMFYFYGASAVGWERYCVLNYARLLRLRG